MLIFLLPESPGLLVIHCKLFKRQIEISGTQYKNLLKWGIMKLGYLLLLILFSFTGTNVFAASNTNKALCWYSNYSNIYKQAAYIDISDDPEVTETQMKDFFASEFKRTVGEEAWASYCRHNGYEDILPYLQRDNTTIHRFKLSPIKSYAICEAMQSSSKSQFEFIKEFPSSTKARTFVRENSAKFAAFSQEQYSESGRCNVIDAKEFATHQSKHSAEDYYKHVAIKWDPAKSVAKTPEKKQEKMSRSDAGLTVVPTDPDKAEREAKQARAGAAAKREQEKKQAKLDSELAARKAKDDAQAAKVKQQREAALIACHGSLEAAKKAKASCQ